jgi:hypothetical protein
MFLMSWGSNQFGQLGLKCDIDTPDPNCLAFIRPMYLPPSPNNETEFLY